MSSADADTQMREASELGGTICTLAKVLGSSMPPQQLRRVAATRMASTSLMLLICAAWTAP